ncbi:hypothetical protein LSTR_LSTR007149 [Laodelphax striatellus]|uniref:DNA-directed RNA polymerase III subunit RPC9 n=1 Tax=Laodelphax striatellus TaxID=195883 RepID=A0A482WW08_LAOST|nr:hypothetical protein LSTR_LSTR007149 [Laodelphax striatellus]
MKVLRKNKDAHILSNFEVFKLLNELKTSSGTQGHSSNLATIVYETSHYLQDEPCGKQNAASIDKMLTHLDQFPVQLTKMEKLMIVNNVPSTSLELSLAIKYADERLNEEQIEELTQTVTQEFSNCFVE